MHIFQALVMKSCWIMWVDPVGWPASWLTILVWKGAWETWVCLHLVMLRAFFRHLSVLISFIDGRVLSDELDCLRAWRPFLGLKDRIIPLPIWGWGVVALSHMKLQPFKMTGTSWRIFHRTARLEKLVTLMTCLRCASLVIMQYCSSLWLWVLFFQHWLFSLSLKISQRKFHELYNMISSTSWRSAGTVFSWSHRFTVFVLKQLLSSFRSADWRSAPASRCHTVWK